MKLGKQIYSWIGKGANKRLRILYDSKEGSNDYAINFIGSGWIDSTYQLVKRLLLKKPAGTIVTDTDLLAHSDYTSYLTLEQTIVLVDLRAELSACRSRLIKARDILKEKGYKVKLISKKQFERIYK